MNLTKLLHSLTMYPWVKTVYLQVGHNRFKIKNVEQKDGYLLLHAEEDADNPTPKKDTA